MNLFILLEYLVLLLLCLVIITLIHFSVPIEQFFVIISQPCLFKCCNNQLVPKYVYHNRVCIDVAIAYNMKREINNRKTKSWIEKQQAVLIEYLVLLR